MDAKKDILYTQVKTIVDKDVEKSATVDFDDLLPYAGEFGMYQLFIFLSTMPFYAYGVFVYFGQVLMTEVPSQHWCWIPELENLTAHQRRDLAIPPDESARYGYSRCSSYAANWSDVLTNGGAANPNWSVIPCQYGWEYNRSEFPYPTISTDLGWVCDKSSYQSAAQTIFFIGSIFGLIGIGYLADRFGRLPAVVVCNLIGCIGGVASIYARDFTEFALLRFFTGLSYDNCMMITYLLVLEYVAPKYRTIISNTSFAVFYTLAAVALPWIALACGHWKTLSLAISIPMALALFAPLVLQESPRWLLSKGRSELVIKNVLTIARINKKLVPQEVIEQFKDTIATRHEDGNANLFELLKRPALRNMFILLCIETMCCDMVFDASIRTLSALNFDYFISFSAVSFAEFPATMAAAFAMDWLGRRKLSYIMMLFSSVFYVMTAFLGHGALSVVWAVIARFSVNMCYITSFQWAAELLPTPVRATGVSVIHMVGYVGTMMAQYVVYLGTYIVWLPLVMAGCVAAIGSLVAFCLPETKGKEMPQTFDDAIDLVMNRDQVKTYNNKETLNKMNGKS